MVVCSQLAIPIGSSCMRFLSFSRDTDLRDQRNLTEPPGDSKAQHYLVRLVGSVDSATARPFSPLLTEQLLHPTRLTRIILSQ